MSLSRTKCRSGLLAANEEAGQSCRSRLLAANEEDILLQSSHQGNLRKARIYNSQNPYFVTLCTHDKNKILTEPNIPEALIAAMKWFILNSQIRFLGFVIMPDYLHWSFSLKGGHKLDDIIGRYKSFTSKEIKKQLNLNCKTWQVGYYDHLLRDIKDFTTKLNYMHNNPVRKGIVENPEDYLYSTANEKYADMVDWGYIGC
ncbi:MAG: transposase [Candidatus Omnitrophota bacterium]